MDSVNPSTAASASSLILAPAPAQGLLAFPGLLNPSPPLSGQEVLRSGRGLPFWRPWLSTNDLPRQVRKVMELDTNGTTAGQVLKANSKFSHPVRLFWPKSRSFDYLYQDGEILLQNFPVQATINVYEDSDSEEEEEDKAKEEKEEADVKDPEECVRFLEYVPCRTTAQPPSPSLTCLN